MNSSKDGSAHCRSSKTMITGSTAARRSKNRRHPANRSDLSDVERSSRPRRCASRGSMNFRSVASGTACSTVSRGLFIAEVRASPSMPAKQALQAIHVLEELPAQPGLADPGDPGHLHEVRSPVVGACEEEILDQLELTVASDERRLQTLGLHQSANAGDDAVGLPEVYRFGLPLQRMHAGVAVRDGSIRRALGRLPDEDTAGLGEGLDARCGMHDVPGHHPLSGSAEVDGGLAAEDARPRAKLWCSRLAAELGHRVDDLERGP